MVLMTLLLYSTLGVLTAYYPVAFSAPLLLISTPTVPATENDTFTLFVTETVQKVISSTPTQTTASQISWAISVAPLLEEPSMTTTTRFVTAIETVSASTSSPAVTTTSTVQVVVTKTVQPPETTTVELVTVTVIPSATQTTTWQAPAQMTDLSPFNVTNFAGGSQNLRIVDSVPADSTLSSSDAVSAEAEGEPDSNTTALQLLYPENSIDPAQKPQGGAEFYASPLDLSAANNVTLDYSVFFPSDFAWVLGGKLPGLYGGHSGCSGGNPATDCFSTRLIWRQDGQGELYLYAPKDKQTVSLCDDPQSKCDAAYGLSVGRGSFKFAQGAWTNVRQTVTLNTPGQQDGCFTLDVDGKRVIDRSDIFYRDTTATSTTSARPGSSSTKSSTNGKQATTTHSIAAGASQSPASAAPSSGGLFGPGGLLGGILRRSWVVDGNMNAGEPKQQTLDLAVDTDPDSATDDSGSDTFVLGNALQGHSAEPTRFEGLFFSTFFGGHEKEYASPKNQLVWFKDFAMSVNG